MAEGPKFSDRKHDKEEDEDNNVSSKCNNNEDSTVNKEKGDLSHSKSPDDSSSMMEKLREFFLSKMRLTGPKEGDQPEQLLEEVNFSGVVKYMQSEKCRNIIVMVGAGISTSAGIPDFRSPQSGIYANLRKYHLPTPECMFDINFFRGNPAPFYQLAKELYPGKFKPTPCHYFLKLLNDKGKLLRLYTQNIDTLERVAGLPGEKVVEAHGTFYTSHCTDCNKEYTLEWMKERIFSDVVPTCTECDSTVKPDIIFFGERLPPRFFQLSDADFPMCDLLIIIGTSLSVQPFASMIDNVPATTPRLLINMQKCGQTHAFAQILGVSEGMNFDSDSNYRDVLWLGDCDDGCQNLADALGWGVELKNLVKEEHERIDALA